MEIRENQLEYRNKMHARHASDSIVQDDWLYDFREITEAAALPVIDPGCGCGNDTKYFVDIGKKMIACDM